MLPIMLSFLVCFGRDSEEAEEYTLKAVYIERFFRFIELPEKEHSSKNIKLGVVGNRNVIEAFEEHFESRTINNQQVVVTEVADITDISNLDVVYITDTSPWEVTELRDSTIHALLIGDLPNMAEEGAIISFIIKNEKLRFRINARAAEVRNIVISSYLLEMAEIVSVGKGE